MAQFQAHQFLFVDESSKDDRTFQVNWRAQVERSPRGVVAYVTYCGILAAELVSVRCSYSRWQEKWKNIKNKNLPGMFEILSAYTFYLIKADVKHFVEAVFNWKWKLSRYADHTIQPSIFVRGKMSIRRLNKCRLQVNVVPRDFTLHFEWAWSAWAEVAPSGSVLNKLPSGWCHQEKIYALLSKKAQNIVFWGECSAWWVIKKIKIHE